MKKILCLLLFVLFALFSVSARENSKIMFKNGKSVLMSDVISKDQFGIMIVCGKDTETGVKLRRFIPFAEMNPASLSLFPFCDVIREQTVMGCSMVMKLKMQDAILPWHQKSLDLNLRVLSP